MFILLADFWSLLLVVPGRVFSPMSFTGAEAQTRCLCFSQLVRTWSVGVYNFRVCSIVPGMMIPVECINTMAMVWVTPENDENNGLLLPSSLAGIDDKPLDLPIGTHFWLKPSGTVPSKFTAPVTRDDLICLESFEGRTGLAASLAFCIARWILHQFDHFCCKMVFIHVWLVSGCSSGQNHTQPKSWAVRRGVDGSKSCYPGENNMSFQMDDRSRKNGTSSIDPSQHWFEGPPNFWKHHPISTVRIDPSRQCELLPRNSCPLIVGIFDTARSHVELVRPPFGHTILFDTSTFHLPWFLHHHLQPQ